MNLIKKLKKYFTNEEPVIIDKTHEREIRELLRENLQTIAVDVFHYDDPVVHLVGPDRKNYLRYFFTLSADRRFMGRLEFLINKQANLTLKNSKDGVLDAAGAMTMNGLSVVKDDVERLSQMFLKEESETPGIPHDSLRGI